MDKSDIVFEKSDGYRAHSLILPPFSILFFEQVISLVKENIFKNVILNSR